MGHDGHDGHDGTGRSVSEKLVRETRGSFASLRMRARSGRSRAKREDVATSPLKRDTRLDEHREVHVHSEGSGVADGPPRAYRRGIAVRRASRALVFGLAAAAPGPVACSSNPSDGRTGSASLSPTEGTGEIRMQLTLPGGEDLSAIA